MVHLEDARRGMQRVAWQWQWQMPVGVVEKNGKLGAEIASRVAAVACAVANRNRKKAWPMMCHRDKTFAQTNGAGALGTVEKCPKRNRVEQIASEGQMEMRSLA